MIIKIQILFPVQFSRHGLQMYLAQTRFQPGNAFLPTPSPSTESKLVSALTLVSGSSWPINKMRGDLRWWWWSITPSKGNLYCGSIYSAMAKQRRRKLDNTFFGKHTSFFMASSPLNITNTHSPIHTKKKLAIKGK